MGRTKPNFKITKHNVDGGTTFPVNNSTVVGRHVSGEAAAQARVDKHNAREFGSSEWFTVETIEHRDGGR